MRIAWVLILLMIFLLPFYSEAIFNYPPLFLHAVLAALLLVFTLAKRKRFKERNILIPLLFWSVIVFAASFLQPYSSACIYNGLYFLMYVVIFYAIAGMETQEKRHIALALITASIIISVKAIVQYFIYFNAMLPYVVTNRLPVTVKEFLYLADVASRRRVISVFENPNLLASYLSMINLLVLGYMFLVKTKPRVLLLIALFMLNATVLWLTYSMAGMAGFAFGFLLFVMLLYAKRGAKSKRPKFPQLFIVSLVFLLPAALLVIRFYKTGPDNFFVSLRDRQQFWSAALEIIKNRPFSWAGPGNFGYLYRLYIPQGAIETIMAHNLLLQLWIETGIYGLLTFIWFIVALVSRGLREILSEKNDFYSSILRISLLCAVCAFLLDNMAGFGFFVPQIAIIWWILCALMV